MVAVASAILQKSVNVILVSPLLWRT